ncbi:MAG: magnesium transporter [Nitrospinae bacterium]|nr:magnesium transporter [Nitrospinota bacterium]
MNEVTPFTLSYLKLHPQSAANVLERLPVEDTVAFLEEIPLDLASRTLEFLAPQYAAQCFLVLPNETCSRLMQEMKATSGISLLRFLPDAATNAILKNLLPDKKVLLNRRLAYSQELVGAWMKSDIPAVSETACVRDIRKSLRLSKKSIEYAPCVINSDGTVLGLLSLARILTAKESIPVSKILEKDFKPISDRVTLQSVSSLPHWNNFEVLPIVNRKNQYIGMLTLKSLNKALAIVKGDRSSEHMDSVLMDGVNAYISTLSWLVQSVAASPETSSNELREDSYDR